MLEPCASCPGLLPLASTSCPHCGASVSGRRIAKAVAHTLAAGGMMMTLMACYGMGPCGDECDGPGPQCGDAHLDEGEECEARGNLATACGSDCTLDQAAFCGSRPALQLAPAGATLDFDTADVFSASCVSPGGRETVFSFTAPAAGTLTLSVTSDADGVGVYVLGDCVTQSPELGCTSGGPMSVDLLADQAVTVVVDSPGLDDNYTDTFFLVSIFEPQP